MKKIIYCFLVIVLLVSSCLSCAPARGPITLKATAFLPWDNVVLAAYRHFIAEVNERGKGELSIKWVGGPEAIGQLEQIEAVRSGVVDVAFSAAGFYASLVPEADALQVSQIEAWEERETGFYDLINEATQEKINAYYLGRSSSVFGYFLFTNFPVKDPRKDFVGHKMRSMPAYDPLLNALGATPVLTQTAEVYTALERGVVDGTAYAGLGVTGWGWHEVLKYVIDLSFLEQSCTILVNLDTWNSLPSDKQKLLIEVAEDTERWMYDFFSDAFAKERQQWADKGIEFITFSPDVAKWYVDLSHKSMWDKMMSNVPEAGAKLKELSSK